MFIEKSIYYIVIWRGGEVKKMENIAETLRNDKELEKLWDAIEKADIEYVLEEEGPYTIFAPTNEAFEKMSSDELNEFLGNKDELINTLKYHIVPGKYTSKDVSEMTEAETMTGENINIDTSKGVRVNKSNVIKTDVEGSNGVIHFIDNPLNPKNR